MSELAHLHVQWSRNLFDSLADGGTWGVPRSGLIYQKIGDTLYLISSMPHEEGMPMTAEELLVMQHQEHEQVSRYFEAAGVKVRKL